MRHETRIGGEHTGHVGPDLDLFRFERRAHERCRVVRATPPQRRGHTARSRSDEPAQHRDAARRDERSQLCAGTAIGLRNVGLGAAGGAGGDDAAARVHARRREAAGGEDPAAQRRRETLTVGDQLVPELRRRTVPDDAPEQAIDLRASRRELRLEAGRRGPVEEALRDFLVSLEVGRKSVRARGLDAREQRVGHAAQGGDHHHRVRAALSPDDPRYALEGGGVLD